jgi:predicted dehydrogenase
MAPLKIGILGAARIADDGIVNPSRVLGHRVVAVAARDRSRAEAFAAQCGIEKVHQTYAEVIDDQTSRWSTTRSSTHCTPSGTSTH